MSVLALIVFIGEPSRFVFTPILALAVGSAGFINSTLSGLQLANFEKLAGSAGALMSMATFSFGALLGALSSLLNDGTLAPIVGVMLGSTIIANAIAQTIPAPQHWDDASISAAQSNRD